MYMKTASEVAVRGDGGAAGEFVWWEWNVMPHLLTQEYSETALYIHVLLLLDQDWDIQDSQCVVVPWIFKPYILPLRPWSSHQLLLSYMPLLAAWYTGRNCSIFMPCSKWVVEAMSGCLIATGAWVSWRKSTLRITGVTSLSQNYGGLHAHPIELELQCDRQK